VQNWSKEGIDQIRFIFNNFMAKTNSEVNSRNVFLDLMGKYYFIYWLPLL